MSIAKKSETGKGNSITTNALVDMAGKMDEWIRTAAAKQWAFHEFESEWHETIHRMANLGMGLFNSQRDAVVRRRRAADAAHPSDPPVSRSR